MTIRRWHRWLAVVAGIFILWIAATGVVTQASRIYAAGAPRAVPAAAASVAPVAAARPVEGAQRPPPGGIRGFVHFVTALHSGEEFGLAGELVSLAAGFALLFFAGSGMWMYWQMLRGRRARPGQPRWFW